ncbi:MAG TPA: NUDIX hydrolase, partial [Ktedonobacteraceae bacterium]|nr:NUDIX hydrolase [Ktedonobacteraceae bacterium]
MPRTDRGMYQASTTESKLRILQRRIVVGYIISSDGQLLLGKKVPGSGGVYPDSWHNPGGGVEPGETDEQALAREVHEET